VNDGVEPDGSDGAGNGGKRAFCSGGKEPEDLKTRGKSAFCRGKKEVRTAELHGLYKKEGAGLYQ